MSDFSLQRYKEVGEKPNNNCKESYFSEKSAVVSGKICNFAKEIRQYSLL
jgi:hypothetical protein